MNPDIFVAVGAAMVAMLLAVTLREIKKEYAVLLSLLCAVALIGRHHGSHHRTD